MTSTRPTDRICEAIGRSVDRVLESTVFQALLDDESLRPGDLVLMNNSFFLRGGRSTVKDQQYLAVPISDSGTPGRPPLVAAGGGMNLQLKRVPAKRVGEWAPRELAQAVADELPRLGQIVFALAGRIGADEEAEVPLKPSDRILRYRPTQHRTAELADGAVNISRLDDVDTVWAAVKAAIESAGEQSDGVAETVEPAFHELQEEAKRPVDLSDVAEDAPSILGAIIERIDTQLRAYEGSLALHRA